MHYFGKTIAETGLQTSIESSTVVLRYSAPLLAFCISSERVMIQ